MSRDDQLQKDILAELNRESRVAAAGMAACRGKGVKAIAEQVEVKLPFENKRSDADIATAVTERLVQDTTRPGKAVKVNVEKDRVIGLSWNAHSMRIFRHMDEVPLAAKHVRQVNAVKAVRMTVAKHFGQDKPMRCSGSP